MTRNIVASITNNAGLINVNIPNLPPVNKKQINPISYTYILHERQGQLLGTHVLILDLNSFRELNCLCSSGKILHNLVPK